MFFFPHLRLHPGVLSLLWTNSRLRSEGSKLLLAPHCGSRLISPIIFRIRASMSLTVIVNSIHWVVLLSENSSLKAYYRGDKVNSYRGTLHGVAIG